MLVLAALVCVGLAIAKFGDTVPLIVKLLLLSVAIAMYVARREQRRRRHAAATEAFVSTDDWSSPVPESVRSNRSSSVLLIEDRRHMQIVFPDGHFDNGIANGFLQDALNGKFSVARGAPDRIAPVRATSEVYVDTIATYGTLSGGLSPRDSYIVACTNDVSFPMFITTSFFDDERHVMFLVDRNGPPRRIGYLDAAHLPVLDSILHCFGSSAKSADLVPLDIDALAQSDLSLRTSCDCVFVLMNPVDPRYEALQQYKLSMYTYRDIDRARIKQLMPCCQLREIDITKIFPRTIGPRRTEVLAEFRNIVVSKTKEFDYLYDYLIQYFERNMGYVNFFSRFFKVHPRAETFQRRFNDRLNTDRSAFPVLEQFAEQTQTTAAFRRDPRMTLSPKFNVAGHYVPKERLFYYDSDVLAGTPLMIGDTVKLDHQVRAEENGAYEVKAVSSTQFGGARLERASVATKVMEEDEHDDAYFCVTDPSLKFRHECVASTDKLGNPKATVDVWDRPCRSNEECPFFDYNPSTKSYVGSCRGGYCDMPQGYTRVGFRKYVNQ